MIKANLSSENAAKVIQLLEKNNIRSLKQVSEQNMPEIVTLLKENQD